MDPGHLRLAEIGLRVAGRYGFALAGGYAVQAHGILERPSEDVDLFTAERAAPSERQIFAAAVVVPPRRRDRVGTAMRLRGKADHEPSPPKKALGGRDTGGRAGRPRPPAT